MFTSLFDSLDSWIAFLILLAASFAVGFLLALLYKLTKKNEIYSKAMPFAILLIVPAMMVLIGLVNLRNDEIEANTAVRVGLVVSCGIALTRFRSEPMKVDDLLYVVISSVMGMILGIGYVTYAAIALILFLVVIFVIEKAHFGENKNHIMNLRIEVPESLNYMEAFDAPLKENCTSFKLVKTKTVDYGQLYEVSYELTLKKDKDPKALLDAVRALNGNLQVVLSDASYKA